MFETTISYNSEDKAAVVTIRGNNLLFDHLEALCKKHPDSCSRHENIYLVPKQWVRILPFAKGEPR
jgi:hypothetical protein